MDGFAEAGEEVVSGEVFEAELFEVGVGELHIEECKFARTEVFDKVDEGDLRSVGFAAEHGFAKEDGA